MARDGIHHDGQISELLWDGDWNKVIAEAGDKLLIVVVTHHGRGLQRELQDLAKKYPHTTYWIQIRYEGFTQQLENEPDHPWAEWHAQRYDYGHVLLFKYGELEKDDGVQSPYDEENWTELEARIKQE